MKINKSEVRAAYNSGTLRAIEALVIKAGGVIVDGVFVKPYQKVTLVGYKNGGTRLVAPKNAGPNANRIRGAMAVINPKDGTVTFIRRTQWTMSDGRECGLFVDGQPVLGYAD
jgi:hypothetical protein